MYGKSIPGSLTVPESIGSIILNYNTIETRLGRTLVEMSRTLPPEMKQELDQSFKNELPGPGKKVLGAIIENLLAAKEGDLPMCQDTGMFWILARIGSDINCSLNLLQDAIIKGCSLATNLTTFRNSVVEDPFTRKNSGNNLPPLIHFEPMDASGIELWVMLKGFGSENGGGAWLLKPTDSKDKVIETIVKRVLDVGGGACPPVVLGIGVGGTLDGAALLSKKALFRKIGEFSKRDDLKSMESQIKENINTSGMGPGGVGGIYGCIHVAMETMPTHIAGLPLVLSVGCWANRKRIISFSTESIS
jgi:fumarate hydratase subunit alpha